jgi:hypothetical protein
VRDCLEVFDDLFGIGFGTHKTVMS